jgi:hypothetical protein
MLFTVEEDLDLCISLDLTSAQLMFIKMLVKDPTLNKPEWKKKSYELTLKFQNLTKKKGLDPLELADLISRGIIEDHNEIGKSFYDYYELDGQFLDMFSLKVYPMCSELFDNYPTEFTNDGRTFLARTSSAEEISVEYLRAIRKDPEEHKKVIDDLKWAVKNNLIKVGLKKFVLVRYWEQIRKLRNTHKTSSNARII